MLSRTANALNWMARYVERAEAGARLAEVNLHLSLDLAGAQGAAWDAVIETTGDLKAFRERYGEATRETALRFLVLDEQNPNSVGQCVRWARENARTVREHLPGEAWELLNSVYLALGTHAGGEPGRLDALLDLVKDRARELEGLLAGSLSRDEGWHFVQVGRFLERADQVSRLVDVQHAQLEGRTADPGHELRWEAVLKSASGLTMYRRRHGATEGRRVAQFLLLDSAFPRSVTFCLAAADQALRGLNGTPAGSFRNPAEKALGKLTAQLRFTELDDVFKTGVHLWLDQLQLDLIQVGDAINTAYFEPGSAHQGDGLPYEQPQQ
ncbi:MAG TPA: alpha-E domain-containing protein [bacterium]|jgi:uncharacterized alpha-E superfamily protein|nr:alpha-E domain-containing protein [bacterium]